MASNLGEIESILQRSLEEKKDLIIVVKGGQVKSFEKHEFGEINVKFHAGEIRQIDSTVKTKY